MADEKTPSVPAAPQVAAEDMPIVNMTPPATSRDRWMYRQGWLAALDPRSHAAAPVVNGGAAPAGYLVRHKSIRTPARIAADGKDHWHEWSDWEIGTVAYANAVTDPLRNWPNGDCLFEKKPLFTAAPDAAPRVAAAPAGPGMYRKKPIIVTAYQLPAAGEDVPPSFEEWCEANGFENWASDREEGIEIDTLGNIMRAEPGDWIIKGVKGEFYPCKPGIFAATYEPAALAAAPAPVDGGAAGVRALDRQTQHPDDTFRGGTRQLIGSMRALVAMDLEGSLVPHGIGGHARALLTCAAARLELVMDADRSARAGAPSVEGRVTMGQVLDAARKLEQIDAGSAPSASGEDAS